MNQIKKSLKHILTKKQEKRYEKELKEKKMSYDTWIKRLESEIEVESVFMSEEEKCLTNDFGCNSSESCNEKNDGYHAEKGWDCRYFEFFEDKEQKDGKLSALLLPPEVTAGVREEKLAQILKKTDADVILLQSAEGKMSEFALPMFYRAFMENENIILIYGDEDVDREGRRVSPWLKPDWSPDTFLSSYYFGSLVAVRREKLLKAAEDGTFSGAEIERTPAIYALLEKMLKDNDAFTARKRADECIVFHIPEILFHADKEGYQTVRRWRLPEHKNLEKENELVSVIIPSKDNPDVLFTCIHSLIEKTKSANPYEIVIVDNGSNAENKQKIEAEVLKLNQKGNGGKEEAYIKYHHEPMTFNFSHMCNLGTKMAKGELLLFLNDDMEIVQGNWLSLMVEKAVLPYAGAVGAKLLYPDSQMIQHAGITNLRVGPAHKLQFLSDDDNHYYGRNRGVHNMMAVTGACLLVKRSVFEQVGGFEEELAVAFNDVDLCYKIFEAGYYNIVRNDVILYHHESLSRGKDGESEEKQLRLLREKDVLYEKHQDIYGHDPFYHKYLTTDMLESEYTAAYHYQVNLNMPWATVEMRDSLPENAREDACVVIGMEGAMDIYKWKYGVAPGKGKREPLTEELGYYFQGYSFVIGANNACYKKTLFLENKATKQVLYIRTQDQYRPDIRKNLKDQLNVDLTGYAGKVRLSDIPEGVYRFGMLAEDQCSRLKLFNYSSWVLAVDDTAQSVTDTLKNTTVNR